MKNIKLRVMVLCLMGSFYFTLQCYDKKLCFLQAPSANFIMARVLSATMFLSGIMWAGSEFKIWRIRKRSAEQRTYMFPTESDCKFGLKLRGKTAGWRTSSWVAKTTFGCAVVAFFIRICS